MAWEGVNFFRNQEYVNILGCSVTCYEYKNVFLMLVDNVCTIQALFVTKPLHYMPAVPWDLASQLAVHCVFADQINTRAMRSFAVDVYAA